MGARLRRFVFLVHVSVSVGWIGAVAAYLSLDISVATSDDVATLSAAYVAMDIIARTVIVPFAFATLFTGVWIALGGPWGLFRHYWVLISFALTVLATVVLVAETRVIARLADSARQADASDEAVRALGNTLPHSVGGLLLLLVILVLNVYKPRGLTPYGLRKVKQSPRS